jgi:hypothetical protein
MCTVPALVLDTSTVRAHYVSSAPAATECFSTLQVHVFIHRYILQRDHDIFVSMTDLYFHRETTDTYGTGIFIVGRSFTCLAASV